MRQVVTTSSNEKMDLKTQWEVSIYIRISDFRLLLPHMC